MGEETTKGSTQGNSLEKPKLGEWGFGRKAKELEWEVKRGRGKRERKYYD